METAGLTWVLIGLVIMLLSCRELDVMLTGEETATQLGVNIELVKRKVLFASSLLTASVISVTGIIGFVGLVVPHVVRLLTGPKHRRLLPVSMVFGGPFFLYLLRKSKKGGGVV